MASRFARVTVSVATTVGICLGYNSLMKIDLQSNEYHFPLRSPWDYNWDRRSVESSVKPMRSNSLREKERYERDVMEYQPRAVRNIFLVRHGSYLQNTTKLLDSNGVAQAELAGKHLSSLNLPINSIVWSTKPRATQTGQIISKYFKNVSTRGCMLLEEGHPETPPEPKTEEEWEPSPSSRFIDGARLEAAFRKYFHRAEPSQTEDSWDILCCHGNIIRYFVLRSLQLPIDAHLNIEAYNAGITWIKIHHNGIVTLESFGDTGFLPYHLITLYGRHCEGHQL